VGDMLQVYRRMHWLRLTTHIKTDYNFQKSKSETFTGRRPTPAGGMDVVDDSSIM